MAFECVYASFHFRCFDFFLLFHRGKFVDLTSSLMLSTRGSELIQKREKKNKNLKGGDDKLKER